MAINFSNTGYINFNKKYNKTLQSGAITFTMTVSNKIEDGTYQYGYINCIIPKRYINDDFKKALKEDKVLVDVSGFITMNGKYANAVVTGISQSKNPKTNEKNEDESEFPF
ncbi:MAG: hypothetical protein J6574_03875 [Gilliamella sp.]|nr:hypothetical protein [Gilliamella sp.]